MLFRDVLFLSALVASASASAAVHPLLISRQNLGQCQNQCALLVAEDPSLQSGACDMSCICTNTFIAGVTSCLDCLQASGQSLQGVPSNFASQLVSECNSAGYPVSGGSSSGSSTGSLGGSGSDSTGGLGGLGGTATKTAGSSSSTKSSSSGGGGLSLGGKSGAVGLSANLSGVLAVAVAVGLVVMSA